MIITIWMYLDTFQLYEVSVLTWNQLHYFKLHVDLITEHNSPANEIYQCE